VACFEKATEKCIDGLKLEIFHPKKNVLDGTALIGLLTTILLRFQEIYKEALSEYTVVQNLLKGLLFILPAFSSFLAIYAGQKGLKKKEELREEARIRAKHLVKCC
jgi:hypothetical protein